MLRWQSAWGNPDVAPRFFHSFSTACWPFTGTRYQEQVMNTNKDQVKGRVREAEGKIKEVAGKIVGNESMELKGKVQKTLGQAQAKFGDVKADTKDAKKGA
jgi:uncharacterized protein YjbJ (UPF0337 family)